MEAQASIDAPGGGIYFDHKVTASWEECRFHPKFSTCQVWETQLSDDVFLELAAITAPPRMGSNSDGKLDVTDRNPPNEQLEKDEWKESGGDDCSGSRGCRVDGFHAIGDTLRNMWSYLKCVLTKLIQIRSGLE